MRIDWLVVATIAGPIAAVIVGAYIVSMIEARPKLVTWILHAGAVTLKPPNAQPFTIHTHALVVRNVGRRPAHNVTLTHWTLPDYSVFPQVPHRREDPPGGGGAWITFSTLAPNEQVTVTYLYSSPLLFTQVNQHTRSDEGIAELVPIVPTRQYPAWVYKATFALIYIGAVAFIYLLVQFGIWISTIKHT